MKSLTTKTIILNQGDAESKREEIRQYFHDTYTLDERLYDTLANEYHDPQRSILITTHQVEEIEQYLTRVMFIHHGRILFDMSIPDIGDRYLRLTIDSHHFQQAQQLGPMYSRAVGDNRVLIYENQGRETLETLGVVDVPGLADLFVATVKGGRR